eukprot:2948093-Pyramimonas_sp.AAC.1
MVVAEKPRSSCMQTDAMRYGGRCQTRRCRTNGRAHRDCTYGVSGRGAERFAVRVRCAAPAGAPPGM